MKKFASLMIVGVLSFFGAHTAQATDVPEGETDITTLEWVNNGQDRTVNLGESANANVAFGTNTTASSLSYVDISQYSKIKLYGTPGEGARIRINYDEYVNNGQFAVTIGENGTYEFDCSTVLASQPKAQHLHLNGILSSAYNTTVNLTLITVYGDPLTFPEVVMLPEEETYLTSLPWVNEGQICDNRLGTETSATIYGTDAGPSNDQLSYVDITNFGSVKLYGHPGDVVRLFINRAEKSDATYQFYVVIGADETYGTDNDGIGVGSFNISDVYAAQEGIKYAHLNGIKAASSWQYTGATGSAKIDEIGLTEKPYVKPDDEIDITTLAWVNEAQGCDNLLGEDTNATVYGTHDGPNGDNHLSYVDITGYKTLKLYGRAGDVVRCFINRKEFPKNFEFYVTIGADKVGTLDLSTVYTTQTDAKYIHLNGVKTAATWQGSSTGKAKIYGITLAGKELLSVRTDATSNADLKVNEIAEIEDTWVAKKIVLSDNVQFKLDNDVTADEVAYVRALASSNWSAICLPFEVPTTALADYNVIKLASVADNSVSFQRLGDSEKMEAHTPYLIKKASDDDNNVSINLTNVEVKASADAEATVTGATLVGIYKAQRVPAGCYALAGGEFKKASENNENLLKPYRAYLQLVSSMQSAPKMNIVIDGEESGIEDAVLAQPMEEGAFYNLRGQKVDNPNAGIYIFKGIKVIVK